MTNPKISRSLIEQVRVETPDDVIYFRRVPEPAERWSISAMDGQDLGSLSVERGYATVRAEGKIIFQNDGSTSPDRFDERIDQEAAMGYIAEHIHELRLRHLAPKPVPAVGLGLRERIALRLKEIAHLTRPEVVMEQSGMGRGAWDRMMEGERGVSGSEAVAIARSLAVPVDWLLIGEDPFPVVALSDHGYRMPPGV